MGGPVKGGFRSAFGRSPAGPSAPPATPSGPLVIQDAYGRVLEPGDEVIFHQAVAPRARLVSVTPVLDPKAPPGFVQVVLRSDWRVVFQAGQPVAEMLKVQSVQEAIDRGILKRIEPTEASLVVEGEAETKD